MRDIIVTKLTDQQKEDIEKLAALPDPIRKYLVSKAETMLETIRIMKEVQESA